jgi:TolB protein
MVSPASGLTANLTNDPATGDTGPAWSPDGTRLALQRSGPTEGSWTMDATGGDLAFVPHTDHGSQPAWSPDGDWIAFTREGPGATTNIMLLALGGGGELAVTPAGGFDGAPDWSPDGKRIAFNRFLPGDGNRVFTVAPSGAALTQRTFGGGPTGFNDVHPAWSPDGARIAFARGGDQDDGLPFHIHTVTLATGRTAQVTSGRVVDLLPSWQPL